MAELLGFPGVRHDDQVDSISQALAFITWRESSPSLTHTETPELQPVVFIIDDDPSLVACVISFSG